MDIVKYNNVLLIPIYNILQIVKVCTKLLNKCTQDFSN